MPTVLPGCKLLAHDKDPVFTPELSVCQCCAGISLIVGVSRTSGVLSTPKHRRYPGLYLMTTQYAERYISIAHLSRARVRCRLAASSARPAWGYGAASPTAAGAPSAASAHRATIPAHPLRRAAAPAVRARIRVARPAGPGSRRGDGPRTACATRTSPGGRVASLDAAAPACCSGAVAAAAAGEPRPAAQWTARAGRGRRRGAAATVRGGTGGAAQDGAEQTAARTARGRGRLHRHAGCHLDRSRRPRAGRRGRCGARQGSAARGTRLAMVSAALDAARA